MKQITRHLFLLCICAFTYFSNSVFADPWQLEGRAGVFILESSRLRKIVNNALPYFELEASYRLCSCWDAWGSASCFFGEGRSLLPERDKAYLQVSTIALGMRRYFRVTQSIEAFLSVGGLWGIYNDGSRVPLVGQHVASNAFGGVAKGGYYYRWNDCFAISVFGEYMMLRFYCHHHTNTLTDRHSLNMNGGSLGLGFLYDF